MGQLDKFVKLVQANGIWIAVCRLIAHTCKQFGFADL